MQSFIKYGTKETKPGTCRQLLLGKPITGSASIVLSVLGNRRFEENSRTSPVFPSPTCREPLANACKINKRKNGSNPWISLPLKNTRGLTWCFQTFFFILTPNGGGSSKQLTNYNPVKRYHPVEDTSFAKTATSDIQNVSQNI